MTDLKVTARLDQPIIGLLSNPFPLDGPLAWVAAQRAGLVSLPATQEPVELDLPLARWDQDGQWGWCASSAQYEVERWTAVEIRRRPATAAMARYGKEAKHHLGLGPHKARNLTVQACWTREIAWYIDTPSRGQVEDLLRDLTHLGKHTNIGYGHVSSWAISEGTPGAWRDRPMPGQGVPIRPPYWHPARQP